MSYQELDNLQYRAQVGEMRYSICGEWFILSEISEPNEC